MVKVGSTIYWKNIRLDRQDHWILQHGINEAVITRKYYYKNFGLLTSIIANVFYITGIDQNGSSVEVYLAIGDDGRIKGMHWITSPLPLIDKAGK